MGAFEQDFLRRQIAALTEAIRKLVGRAKETGEVDPVLDELTGKGTELLGVPWEILAQVDVASAKMLLGKPGKNRRVRQAPRR